MRDVTVGFGSPRKVMVARRLVTSLQRLRGLLLTGRDARPVLLEGCGSVHTFGMGYPIDVAFLGDDGTCLLAVRGVCPGRVLGVRGARSVLERPASEGPWPGRGERVELWVGHAAGRASPRGTRGLAGR